MKSLFVFAIISLPSTAFSSEVLLKKCGPLAEKTVKNQAGRSYDRNGFLAYQCEIAPNKAVVICELGASKDDGAATDTYRAVLNKACTSVLRVDLIGEE